MMMMMTTMTTIVPRAAETGWLLMDSPGDFTVD
jgi:hypothetical protein